MNWEQIMQAIVQQLVQQALPHLLQAHQNHVAQQQQGNPAQQAFGNPGGMQTAPGGTQNGSVLGTSVAGQPVAQNMFGGAPAQQASAPTVTPDMIQTLITPMVQNEQVKAALTAQMQQMGIQNLPDARPDQLAELYQRFQSVEQQARAAGLLGGGQQAAGAPSII